MVIKIGTRNSPLALWQAREIARQLENLGYQSQIVPIIASGDKNLAQPLYSMGITGVFTKDLDLALINKEIDIAVHSLKDVPTQLPENIELIAHLRRDFPQDVLVRNSKSKEKPLRELKIATSSLRRRSFWLKEFPGTQFVDIRGNVNTRLQKIEDGLADATVFSLAGLKRLELNLRYEELPFMISAPAQGVVTIAGRSDNQEIVQIVKAINDAKTEICINTERAFLQTLEGGCTAPIGAFAEIQGKKMRFIARLSSLNGENSIETDEILNISEENPGKRIAEEVLKNGGKEIMEQIKLAQNKV